MSIHNGHSPERGYSMVELMVAMAVTTVIMLIIFGMIEEAATLSGFIESHNDLTTMSQKALNQVQTEILQAKQIFTEDAIGTRYRTEVESLLPACAYPCAGSVRYLPPVAGTQLPAVDPAPTLAPDPAGNRYTGNALLIARQLPPLSVSVIADPGNPTTYPAFTFNADRYRFEYFYLTWHGSPSHRAFRNGDHIVDMWQVRTVDYADYFQLLNATATMSAAQQQDLAAKLTRTTGALGTSGPASSTCCVLSGPNPPNLTVAWNPGQPFDSAFWTIDSALAFPPANQLGPNFNLTLNYGGSLMPALIAGRIAGKMDYTVAYVLNRNLDPKQRLLSGVPLNGVATNGRNPLPQYAQLEATLPLDCGLEVKIVGQPGSRQVLTRLVLYSNYRVSKVDSAEAFVITSFTRT